MIVIGLTGSIGMGKTTVASQFRRLGVPIFDADRAVHRLLGPFGAAVAPVAAAFSGTVENGAIDRARLAARVFGKIEELRKLEAILHPLVNDAEREFRRMARRRKAPAVVLDIPLLFETRGQRKVDKVVVVSCPAFLQEQRVLKRPGMTPARLRQIRHQQWPDWQKRLCADFVIPTGLGKRFSLSLVKAMLSRASGPGRSKPYWLCRI